MRAIGARLGKEKDAHPSQLKTLDIPDLIAETDALLKGAALEERFFQDPGQNSLFEDAEKLSKLCYLLMFRFDGYPELYLSLIRSMRTVWVLEISTGVLSLRSLCMCSPPRQLQRWMLR